MFVYYSKKTALELVLEVYQFYNNFIGAKSEIKETYQLMEGDRNKFEVLKFCSDTGIMWHTIPHDHLTSVVSGKQLLKAQSST